MGQGRRSSWIACVCAMLLSAPAGARAEELTGTSKEWLELLTAQHAVVERRRVEWITAFFAARTAREQAQRTETDRQRVAKLQAALVSKVPGAQGLDTSSFLQAEELKREEEETKAAELKTKADALRASYVRLANAYVDQASKAPPEVLEELKRAKIQLTRLGEVPMPVEVQAQGTAPVSSPAPVPPVPAMAANQEDMRLAGEVTGGTCAIDTPEQRLNLSIEDCATKFQAQRLGPLGAFGTRVLPASGLSTDFSTSEKSQGVTLKFATTISDRYRSDSGIGADAGRVPGVTGINIGVRSDKGLLFSVDEDRKTEDREIGDLELLDTSLVVLAGISYGQFPRESREAFEKRAKPLYEKIREACEKDVKAGTAPPSTTCWDEGLLDWAYQRKKDHTYANLASIADLYKMYYGSVQEKPTWGFGLQGQVGRPVFKYHDFATVNVTDPISGETKTIIDVNNLPTTFLQDKPLSREKWDWALTPFLFYHWPFDGDGQGATLIGSFTLKRDWEVSDDNKDVEICPVLSGPFTTPELCRKANIAGPELKKESILGAELRTAFRVPMFGYPLMGLAPKLTWDAQSDRMGAQVPLLIDLDDKGNLVGGLRYEAEWGGKTGDGMDRKDEHRVSILLGASFDLSGLN